MHSHVYVVNGAFPFLSLLSICSHATGGRLTGIQAESGLHTRSHAMEMMEVSSKSPLECTCNQRYAESFVSATSHSSLASTATRNVCNSQNVEKSELVTSRVTCATNNSLNRKKSIHFCRCLRRRRALLKRWSRRHREGVHSRTSMSDSECSKGPLEFKSHTDPILQRLGELVITEGLDCEIIKRDRKLTLNRDENSGETISCERRRLISDKPLPNRDCITHWHDAPDIDDVIFRGARIARDIVAPFGKVVTRFGGLMAGLLSAAERWCTGLVRARRRHWTDGVPDGLGWTHLATPMTFHRWAVLLLVCVMVLPPPTSAAPNLPWQTGEESKAEPGFKYSYYEELPPKAMYESVIICLLAVSAFIGLIVWVLKTNFEERQQKRMRREASLRERTSSIGFIKT